jgi:hypothetical protein
MTVNAHLIAAGQCALSIYTDAQFTLIARLSHALDQARLNRSTSNRSSLPSAAQHSLKDGYRGDVLPVLHHSLVSAVASWRGVLMALTCAGHGTAWAQAHCRVFDRLSGMPSFGRSSRSRRAMMWPTHSLSACTKLGPNVGCGWHFRGMQCSSLVAACCTWRPIGAARPPSPPARRAQHPACRSSERAHLHSRRHACGVARPYPPCHAADPLHMPSRRTAPSRP